MPPEVSFLIFVSIALMVLAIVLVVLQKKKEADFENNASSVYIGMTYTSVQSIMGSCDKISRYKDGSFRCTWTYKKNGYSYRLGRGVYAHNRGYTLKLNVKFDKDGKAVEVVNT